jgi:hypothetical protein
MKEIIRHTRTHTIWVQVRIEYIKPDPDKIRVRLRDRVFYFGSQESNPNTKRARIL